MRLAIITTVLLTPKFGVNLITNGTFPTVTTGWSAVSTPTTFEVSSGRVHIVADSNGDGMGQVHTLIAGAPYRLMFDYEVVSGGLNVTKVGMTSIAGLTGSGTQTHLFTESDGTARNLLFQLNGAGEVYLDNIILQRVL